MRMVRAVATIMLTTAMLGCTEIAGLLPDDATEEVVFAAMAATWSGTKFEFTNNADASETYDVIANGGTLTLTITEAGRYSGAMVMGEETEQISGTLQVQGENLVMVDDAEPNDPMTATYTLTATTLTLRFGDAFDFNGDGIDEDATVQADFSRM